MCLTCLHRVYGHLQQYLEPYFGCLTTISPTLIAPIQCENERNTITSSIRIAKTENREYFSYVCGRSFLELRLLICSKVPSIPADNLSLSFSGMFSSRLRRQKNIFAVQNGIGNSITLLGFFSSYSSPCLSLLGFNVQGLPDIVLNHVK